MRVFVSEYITGGALAGTILPPSLLREGQAMLTAIVADFLAIDGCHIVTTLDRRLAISSALLASEMLEVVLVDNPPDEQAAFLRACTEADATLVIAPETGNVLRQRVQSVHELNRASLNCLPAAIDLCGDKLCLAVHLIDQGIATIPTQILQGARFPWEIVAGDCVVKLRDGAGSWLTSLVCEHDEPAWKRVRNNFVAEGAMDQVIVQPFVAGTPLSVGCLCTSSGSVEIFPLARQYLTEGNFQYQGGSLPTQLDESTIGAIESLVQAACSSISGLLGYIGIDLLLPSHSPEEPVLVEINPRLTTSYVGYRKLCRSNLAQRMLSDAPGMASRISDEPLAWHLGRVEFDAGGECRYFED